MDDWSEVLADLEPSERPAPPETHEQAPASEASAELELAAEPAPGPTPEPARSFPERQADVLTVLTATLEGCADDRDAAHVLFERAQVRAGLSDHAGALDDLVEATRKNPDAVYIARAYLAAALRAGANDEVVAALELAARLEPQRELRGVLELYRGAFSEHPLGDLAGARAAYARAAESSPREQAAWLALERLAVVDRDLAAAAEAAQKLCALTSDGALAGEHGARVARYLESAGRATDALAAAKQARVQAPDSPSVEHVLERLLSASDNFTELLHLRERQIARGTLPEGAAWLDVGLIARYRVGDRAAAKRAFEKAAAASSGSSRAVALAELASVLERDEAWEDLLRVQLERAEVSRDAGARAHIWFSVARVREQKLGDLDGAIEAYEHALAEDATHGPALRAAVRAHEARSPDDRALVTALRAQAGTAETPAHRAIAATRAALLLAEGGDRDASDGTPKRASKRHTDEAIALLRSALEEMPTSLAVIEALEELLRQRGDWAGLAQLYEAQMALAGEGRRAALWARIGELRADLLDDQAGAIEAFERAILTEVSPPSDAPRRLAMLLEREERWDDAAGAWERALEGEVDPVRQASAFARLASVRARLGDRAGVVDALRRAFQLAPPAHPVHVVAERLFAEERPSIELAELFALAARMGSARDRAAWLVRSAEELAALPDRAQEAIARLRQARELWPDHPHAKPLLRELLAREERWDVLRSLDVDAPAGEHETFVRRAALAEAAGHLEEAFELYGEAVAAGVTGASVAYQRLAARGGHWAEAARTYAETGAKRSSSVEMAVADATERLHALYRAAEIAAERLSDIGLARETAKEAVALSSDAIAPRLLAYEIADDDDALEALDALESATDDPAFGRALALMRFDRLRRLGRDGDVLALARDLLARAPRDPVLSVHVEVGLEEAGDLDALAWLHDRTCSDPGVDPTVRAAAMLSLGRVCERMGAWREAADAYEAAVHADHVPPSRVAALSLPHIGHQLSDESLLRGALWSVGGVLSQGAESAACLAWLGRRLASQGELTDAIDAYEAALASDPTAYPALLELEQLLPPAERDQRVIDALERALEVEERPGMRAKVAETLAVRMLRKGRVVGARDGALRALEEDPESLSALMVLAEVHRHDEAWDQSAEVLERIASHLLATDTIRLLAYERLASIYSERLDRPKDVDRVVAAAREVESDAPETLERRLAIEQLSGRHEAAATTLRRLIDSPSVAKAERVRYLLRLARLQEDALDDPAGAIRSLGELESFDHTEEAVARLLRLGERSGRWDLACEALESALDAGRGENPQWEVAIRSRLASLLEGPLERPEAAAKHWERIVEIDPTHADAIERLAALATDDADGAIRWLRLLVAARPQDVEVWRALRKHYLDSGDVDGAFCVEAVLYGAELANDEEAYFHQQRCAFLSRGFANALSAADLALLFPEREAPTMQLLAVIDRLLPDIFPFDAGAYGAEPDDLPIGLSRVLHEVSEVMGVPRWQAVLVPARVGPAIEPLAPPLLLLPRSSMEAPRREQQLVCAALFARAAFAGAIADPLRVNRVSAGHVDLLIAAAREVVTGATHEELAESPIYEDIRTRLESALDAEGRAKIASILNTAGDEPFMTGDEVHAAHGRAALRAAVLLAQDPAVLLTSLGTWASMFDLDVFGGSLLEIAADAGVLSFIVSEEHAKLRRRLQTEVSK